MLRFKPIYQQRIWGGDSFTKNFGRKLPGEKMGESWEIVDRPEAQSCVVDSFLGGDTLSELLQSHCEYLLGPKWQPEWPFPLLVKWLDCREWLSVQVHPPAHIAPQLGGQPKTEWWYFADCDPGARIILGLKPSIDRNQFLAALDSGTLPGFLSQFFVQSGDSAFVESGCIHALGPGNLILEIQQNSDTTYRVFDWNRVNADGQTRELHREAALQSINFALPPPSLQQNSEDGSILANCPHFRIQKRVLMPSSPPLAFEAKQQARLIHVIQGSLQERREGDTLSAGSNVLLPYGNSYTFLARTPTVLLITDQFHP